MRVYKEVPQWWYIAILLGSFAVGCGTLYGGGPNFLPAWSMLLFVGICQSHSYRLMRALLTIIHSIRYYHLLRLRYRRYVRIPHYWFLGIH